MLINVVSLENSTQKLLLTIIPLKNLKKIILELNNISFIHAPPINIKRHIAFFLYFSLLLFIQFISSSCEP